MKPIIITIGTLRRFTKNGIDKCMKQNCNHRFIAFISKHFKLFELVQRVGGNNGHGNKKYYCYGCVTEY